MSQCAWCDVLYTAKWMVSDTFILLIFPHMMAIAEHPNWICVECTSYVETKALQYGHLYSGLSYIYTRTLPSTERSVTSVKKYSFPNRERVTERTKKWGRQWGRDIFPTLKVPKQCPLGFLVQVFSGREKNKNLDVDFVVSRGKCLSETEGKTEWESKADE